MYPFTTKLLEKQFSRPDVSAAGKSVDVFGTAVSGMTEMISENALSRVVGTEIKASANIVIGGSCVIGKWARISPQRTFAESWFYHSLGDVTLINLTSLSLFPHLSNENTEIVISLS